MKILRKMKNIFLALMIGREPLIAVLKTIIKVRILEKKLIPLFRQGEVKRMIYSDYGQEGGVAVITHFLEKKDVLMPHYRGFTAAIGKGMNTKGMVGEMVAKKTGTVAGYGGAGNFFSTEDNIYSAPAILGQGFSVVIGMGLATRFRNDGSIVVMFFGDGTTTRGNFYSALNLAVLWSLPILFVCINNQYSVTTRFTDTSMTPLIEKVRSFGMPSVSLDGNDVVALFSPTKK